MVRYPYPGETHSHAVIMGANALGTDNRQCLAQAIDTGAMKGLFYQLHPNHFKNRISK